VDLRRCFVFLDALGLTIFVFGILLWSYSVAIQITHPEWLRDTLTHHTIPPLNWRVDDLGIIGFGVAPLGFLIWILSHTYVSTWRRPSSPTAGPVEIPRNGTASIENPKPQQSPSRDNELSHTRTLHNVVRTSRNRHSRRPGATKKPPN
jgi:hypothetical protein